MRHKPFIILLLILAVYLGIKTFPENGWSGWAFGAAQNLMTVKNWTNDGIVYSKFLLAPFGYSKTTRYLDESEMRHHAHGTVTGELIGQRLYYTHYPSGYLIPFAILWELGFTERYWFRLLALLFSLAALVLMYKFFCLITDKTIAFLAVLYYAGSQIFLDFADVVNTQPNDDLLRFLILFLSVLAIRSAADLKKFRIYNIFVWLIYFVLALNSYDYTFYIFVWLVGLDVLAFRKFLWKKWLFWASAPVVAFALQLFQNWWYLGNWHDVWLDLYGAFKYRVGAAPGSSWLERHLRVIFSPLTHTTDLRARYAIPVVSILFLFFLKLKKYIPRRWPDREFLAILFLAGCAAPFIFVSPGYWDYQARQIAPFVSLLVASGTVLVFSFFRSGAYKNLNKYAKVLFFIIVVLSAALWFFQAKRTYSYVSDWPNHKMDQRAIDFSKTLDEIRIKNGGDAVVFRLTPVFSSYFFDYPQASPELEYYVGMPILSFRKIDDLIRDFKWLKNRSEYPFHSIVVVDNNEQMEEIKEKIGNDATVSIFVNPGGVDW